MVKGKFIKFTTWEALVEVKNKMTSNSAFYHEIQPFLMVKCTNVILK